MCLSTHPHCSLNIFLSHLPFHLWHLANNLPFLWFVSVVCCRAASPSAAAAAAAVPESHHTLLTSTPARCSHLHKVPL